MPIRGIFKTNISTDYNPYRNASKQTKSNEHKMVQTIFRTLLPLLFISISIHSKANDFYDRDEVQARLESMECIVKPIYTTAVESYIKGYFKSDALKARVILARTVTFFPIFENYLSEHQMPSDLKYLAVLESALNPKAVSRVGATGLWQFMKETGTGYGLKINSRIDERSCPNRSTMAALEYMTKAYNRFGSWELAIASYNCGAGNIRKAIRRSGGKTDYWEISKYLPRETRNFVPAFLGAAYMVKYHHLHGVQPDYRDLDFQLTESELIFSELAFETIAAVAGIPISVVKKLNPAYKKGYIPANVVGHWVVLPRRTMQALRDYVILQRPDNNGMKNLPELPMLVDEAEYYPNGYYYRTYYSALKEDDLYSLGKIFSCSGYNLKVWNRLSSDKISEGQELLVWFPREPKRYQPFSQKIEVLSSAVGVPKKVKDIRTIRAKVQPIEMVKLQPIPIKKPLKLPQVAVAIGYMPKTNQSGVDKMRSWVDKMNFRKKQKKGSPALHYY